MLFLIYSTVLLIFYLYFYIEKDVNNEGNRYYPTDKVGRGQ